MSTPESGTAGALAGLRVVNLSPSLGGASVGQFFADHGAEVVLVEPPGGSPLRSAAGWPIWARGSKSLEARLDDPAVRALALGADVLIDTFRPGVLERHGLGHQELSRENPGLVTVSITGFGRDNPLSHLKGYEGLVMARLGAYTQLGDLVTRPGPAFATVPSATLSAAYLAFTGTLTALYERETSGLGQRVDATLVQGLAAHDCWNWMVTFWARKYPDAFVAAPIVNTTRRVPNSWLRFATCQALTKDGRWLQFSQSTPKHFRAFRQVTGLDGEEWQGAWEDDDLDRRVAFWDALLTAVRSRTVAEWQAIFETHGDVFAEVFRRGTELLDHPQVRYDDQVVTVEQPGYGPVKTLKPFVRLSRTPGSASRPLPSLNQHHAELRARPTSPRASANQTSPPKEMPLTGVTIVELGTFYAAPFGVTLLTDFGARVIKIEQIEGDAIRSTQLPMPEMGGVKVTQGKESIAVNIQTPEGLAIVKKLLAGADMVLQSYRAGVAKRLGLDEASVRAINADVIYHEAPGFGTGGPYGHKPAYAPTIGAGTGMSRRMAIGNLPERPDMTLSETKDAVFRLAPAGAGVAHSDGFSSLGVSCAQMLGLLARARGAGGQGVVTTMLTTVGQILSEDMVEYDGRPKAAVADQELHGFGPLYRLYESADGWVFLAAPRQNEWEPLVRAMPASAELDDPRFADAEGRAKHADELTTRLAKAIRARPGADWERELTAADVGCVVSSPQVSHDTLMFAGGLGETLGIVTEVEHPVFGLHPRLTSLVAFSRSATCAKPGVLAGEQTVSILREIGFTDAEINDLAQRGVVSKG
jgi:crotonobetainyl-CoA:carnitine CoA-transferase CaiB-like acyl-CoA transferase